MQTVSEGMEKTSSTLSRAADTAAKTYVTLASRFQEVQQGHNQLQANLRNAVETFASQMRQQMQDVTKNASIMQEDMLNFVTELGETFDRQVEALDQKMADLLQNFARITSAQMDGRMSEWDKQTRNFCDKMVATVQAMGEVVESLEMQPRR